MSTAAFRVLALGLAVLAMAPLRHEFPPITDFPEHTATIATLSDAWTNGPLSNWYELDFLHTQYWLMAVLGALLAPLVGGPVAALKTLLVLSSVGLVAALMRLAKTFELDERLVLVAIPLLWSRPFTLGFIPFVMAAPLVVWALAELGGVVGPSRRSHVLVSALSLAVFFLNLASVVWLGVAALSVVATRHFEWRRLTGLVALVVPSVGWLAFSSVTNVDTSRFAVSMDGRWWSPKHLLLEAPSWLMDRWSGNLDVVLLVVLVLAIVALAEARSFSRPGLALFLSTAALTLALPFERGWLWGLSTRFLPVTLMLAPFVWSRRARGVVVGVFAAVGLISSWNVEQHVSQAQDEIRGVSLLKDLPVEKRVLQLTFDDGSAVVNDSIVSHASAYHRVWNHGANEPSFVDLPQSVVRYREGKVPWTRPWPWEFKPNEYDNAREGAQYDFVLTRGQGVAFPPPVGTEGPTWTLLRESGAWRLYSR